jgi:hypothetical protein
MDMGNAEFGMRSWECERVKGRDQRALAVISRTMVLVKRPLAAAQGGFMTYN